MNVSALFYLQKAGELIADIDILNIKATADEENAERGLNRLLNTLERIQRVTQSTAEAGNRYTQSTERIRKATDKATKSHEGLLKKIGNTANALNQIYYMFDRYTQRLRSMYKASNEYIETSNLFSVTMRENTASALKFAESVENIMGIDISQWMKYQGTFKQLASGFGVASDNAAVMSKNLTQLSYDLASFFNVSNDTAFDKLSSAMTGQVKGLRQFGIDTTNASLQEYALAKGIDLTITKMTQAQKSVLRYNYILEKTANIHGDLARTIQTPANAMRILSALIERLQRSFGNVVSVLVTKFIPYIQAGIMLLTDLADRLAKAWGFELPKIDYSGLDTASSYIEDTESAVDGIAENADDAAQAVKKLKYQLMGFDELNILKSPADDTASKIKDVTAGLNAYPSDLGLGIPEYNFGLDKVSSQAKKIYDNLKKFLKLPFIEKLKTIYDYIWNKIPRPVQELIKLFASLFAIKLIGKLIGKFKDLWGLLKFSSIGRFFSAFAEGWKNADSGTNRFMSGLKNARNSLTTLQKVALVAASAIVGYFSSKDFFYKLKSDSLDAVSAIMDIVGMAGSLATAFAAGGWIGLAIAAVAELIGMIKGVDDAVKEALKRDRYDAFYNGVGIPISKLGDAFTGVMDKIKETYLQYDGMFADLAENRKNIDTTVGNVNAIKSAFDNGAISAEVACERIKSATSNLPSQIKDNNTAYYNTIYNLLYSPFGDAVESAGLSKIQLLKYAGDLVGSLNAKADIIQDKMAQLGLDKEAGRISNGDYINKMAKLTHEMDSLKIEPPKEAEVALLSLQGAVERFDTSTVNFMDKSTWESTFSSVTSSAKAAKDQINKSYDEAIATAKTFAERLKKEGNLDGYNKFMESASALGVKRKQELEEVKKQFDLFTAKIGAAAVEKQKELQEKIDEEWRTNPLQMFTDKEEFYRENYIEFQREYLTPLDKFISQSYSDLGFKGEGYAAQSAMRILQGFSPSKGFSGISAEMFETNALSVYKRLVETEGKALVSSTDGLKLKLETTMDKTIVSLKNKSTYGGIDIVRSATDAAQRYANNNPIRFSAEFNFDTNLARKLTFKERRLGQFASGGFPEMGEMFIARESGPEMVGRINSRTAVVNNDQIVQSISRAVYEAFTAANQGTSTQIHIVNEIDGEVVTEKVIKHHNNEVRRTGMSPLLI